MTKKEYQKPTMNVVKLKTQAHLLNLSQANATGLGENEDLYYNKGSDDMGNAWSRGSNLWDDED